MITLEDCKQAKEYNYKGLSTDEKPLDCYVNSLFLELDTGIFYFFNGTEWKDISQGITLGETAPTGTISITENGIFDVHDYAEADVDVPAITPTGTISITENGIFDVHDYAEASVDVDLTVNFNLPALTRSIPTVLSQARSRLAATNVGGYALFGGGTTGSLSVVVNAYDSSLTRSTPTSLSRARESLAATNIGGYALFGGGYISSFSNVVDAYDTSLTRSTPTALSQARSRLAATNIGGYALFGGGHSGSGRYSIVDAYDSSLTRSTPTSLSQAREYLAATNIGGYALFGGGYADSYSNVVDAYDNSLTRSTPTSLSQYRTHLAATSVAHAGGSSPQSGYALFAGGYYNDSGHTYPAIVDAYDTSLTRTTPTALSEGREFLGGTNVSPIGGSSPQSGYALFGGGSNSSYVPTATVDAYNTSLTRITPTELSQARDYLAATNIGGYALFGGGETSSTRVAVVDAYSLASYDIQVFPGTKYSFNGSTEETSSTWQTLTMQGEVIGYIKVKDATVN